MVYCEASLSPLTETAIGLESDKNVLVSIFVGMKNEEIPLQELSMKWLLKTCINRLDRNYNFSLKQGRFSFKSNFKLSSAILEHFIQREVVKRMQLEEKN